MAEALTPSSRSSQCMLSADNGEGESTPQKTVLRLKRRIEDSPSQVLVVSFKRWKQDVELESVGCSFSAAKEELFSQVFRLAGTVTSEKDSDYSLADTIHKALLEVDEAKKRVPDTREAIKNRVIRRLKGPHLKAKEDVRKQSSENRFKVISNRRGYSPALEMQDDGNAAPLETDSEPKSTIGKETERLFNLLDLVSEHEAPPVKKAKTGSDPRKPGSVTCNGVPMVREKAALEVIPLSSSSNGASLMDQAKPVKDSEFVFDLYVSNEGAVNEKMHNQFVSVRHADEDYALDSYRESESEEEGRMDDDEDSNEEGNWKNEYPDTDPDSADDTDGCRGYYKEDYDFSPNFGKMKLNGDELSSDDEADGIYSMEDDGVDTGLGRIQSQYQSYKARLLREQEMADEVVSSPSDSD